MKIWTMTKYISSQILHKKHINDNDNISYNDCDNDDDNVESIDIVQCTLGWLPKESGKEHLPGRLPHK